MRDPHGLILISRSFCLFWHPGSIALRLLGPMALLIYLKDIPQLLSLIFCMNLVWIGKFRGDPFLLRKPPQSGKKILTTSP